GCGWSSITAFANNGNHFCGNAFYVLLLMRIHYWRMIFKPLRFMADDGNGFSSFHILGAYHRFVASFLLQCILVNFNETNNSIHLADRITYPRNTIIIEVLWIAGLIKLDEL